MPSYYRMCMAVALMLVAGWFNMAAAVGTGVAALETRTEEGDSKALGSSIQDITTENQSGQFSARIHTDGLVRCKHFILHRPERLVVDVPNVRTAMIRRVLDINAGPVERIRIGTPAASSTRIVFDLKVEGTSYDVTEEAQGLLVRFGADLAKTKSAPESSKPVAELSVPEKSSPTEEKTPALPAASRSRKTVQPPKAAHQGGSSEIVAKETVEADLSAATNLAELKPASFTRVSAPTPTPVPSTSSTTSTTSRRHKTQTGGAQFGDPSFQGDPISLDITGVDLSDILRFISDSYDVNFVLDKSVPKVDVTIKVNNVPWGQVLNSIFRANRLSYKREDMIIRVATFEAFAEEQKKETERREAVIENYPLVTEYFKLKYEQVGAGGGAAAGGIGLRAILAQNLSKRGNISVNPRTNMMIITDIPEKIDRCREIIGRLDVAEPQVEIEARIVQANRSFLRDLGIQLFTGVVAKRGGGIAFSTAGGNSYGFKFDAADNNTAGSGLIRGQYRVRNFVADSLFIGPLSSGLLAGRGNDSVLSLTTGLIGTGFISSAITASESKGIVKTIASPRVTVQNNSEGEIKAGQTVPYTAAQAIGATAVPTTTFIDATLSLKITPQITSEGNVLLRLDSTNDSVDRSFAVNGQPPINRQSAKTIVLVPDGGTTIIGGVNIDSESNTQTRTPGISGLPIIGNLFKQRAITRTTSELLFFITPRIFRGENFVTNGEPAPEPVQGPATTTQPNPGGQP